MLTGENGILTQANNAKEATEKASVIEQAQIDILGKQADNSSGELERNDIKEILDKYFKEVPDDFTSDTVLDTKEEYGNYKIPVSEIYDGEINLVRLVEAIPNNLWAIKNSKNIKAVYDKFVDISIPFEDIGIAKDEVLEFVFINANFGVKNFYVPNEMLLTIKRL